jgi:hypothetical protein
LLSRSTTLQRNQVRPIPEFSHALNRRYAFKATVYKSRQSPGFSGYGDADPSNVSFLVHGAEMRGLGFPARERLLNFWRTRKKWRTRVRH